MERVKVNGVELEFVDDGSGEPVLLIDMLIPDCFAPLVTEPSLGHYRLIRYHKRGWVGSTHTPPPVSIVDHAADAAALLEQLGLSRAHIAGHSSGGSIAVQLALDHPDKVHTLTLLEPTLVSLPLGQAFLRSAGPVFDAYRRGDRSGAFAMFASAASGLDWEGCRALLEERIPGVVARSIEDADTFFGIELPSLPGWTFGPEQAATIHLPVLSVLGAETQPVWLEIAEFLRSSLPNVEDCTIEGAGHLLQIQRPEPVARAMADFLRRNPMPVTDAGAPTRITRPVDQPLGQPLRTRSFG